MRLIKKTWLKNCKGKKHNKISRLRSKRANEHWDNLC